MIEATVCYRADTVSQCGSCRIAEIEIGLTGRFAGNPNRRCCEIGKRVVSAARCRCAISAEAVRLDLIRCNAVIRQLTTTP